MSTAETRAKAEGLLAGTGVDAERLVAIVETVGDRTVAELVDAATA